MNVSIPLKSICWNLIPNVMVFGGVASGRWLGHEGGVLMNGISALIKETPESSLNPSIIWRHSEKMAIYEPGNDPYKTPDLPVPWSWISQFPELGT